MNDDKKYERQGYEQLEEHPKEDQDETESHSTAPIAPVTTTTLLSSTMLSQRNNKLKPEYAERVTLPSKAPTASVPHHSTDTKKEAPPETALPGPGRNAGFNFKAMASKATKVKKMANIGGAVNVLADFIPVVGSSGVGTKSRVRKTDRPIDTVDADELAAHPLHYACALSASATNSSTTPSGGGDLSSIKQLVEQNPTVLQAQLPTSRDTPLHVAIKFGAMQWNQMLEYPGGTANVAVIEFLIKAEIDLLRSRAVNQKNVEGEKSPISLKSLILQTALYKQDCSNDLPIHAAAAEGFDEAVRILLKVDKDAGFGSILEPGGHGNLPLHFAVLRDDLALVKFLIAIDRKRDEQEHETAGSVYKRKSLFANKVRTLFVANNDGDIPLHLALPSHLKFELWNVLLEPDAIKETLYIENLQGMDAFHFFLDQPTIFKDEEEFVDTHLAHAILKRLLSGRRLEPWDDHLKRSVAKSSEMQLMMNNASADRLPVMIFIADFYAHVCSIAALFMGTDYYLKTGSKREAEWLAEVVYAMVAYFSAREFIQLLLSKSLYWTDFWNYTDLVRICMLALLSGILQAEDFEDDDEQYTYFLRRFLVALAVFMFVGFLSFLRITYLQFALFVGGTAQIVVTLIPLMVTFVLVLGLFAYGYWVGGFAEQSYGLWVLELFFSAMNGPDGLATMEGGYIDSIFWTALFVILAQVLLLNVLIAVITSAWEEITDRQNEVFWKYRLEYAAGVLPMEHFLRKNFGATYIYRCIAGISGFIDSLEAKPVLDQIDWNVSPYSKVIREPTLYWDKKGFEMAMLEDLDSRRYDSRRIAGGGGEEKKDVPVDEIREAWRKMRSFEADYRFANSSFQRMGIRLKQFGFYLLWFMSFLVGFLTLGFCWPRKLRLFFCAPSTTGGGKDEREDGSMATPTMKDEHFLDSDSGKDSRSEALEKKIDDMKGSIEALQKTVEALVKLQSGN